MTASGSPAAGRSHPSLRDFRRRSNRSCAWRDSRDEIRRRSSPGGRPATPRPSPRTAGRNAPSWAPTGARAEPSGGTRTASRCRAFPPAPPPTPSNSAAHSSTGAFLSAMRTRDRLCTIPPLPTTSTPSSRRGRKRAPQLKQLRRIQKRHGNFQHRKFRLRPGQPRRDPCAVIQPAYGIEGGVLIAGQQHVRDSGREARVSRRRVLDAVELVRKAAEVVEQRHVVPRRHAQRPRHLPVRRNDEDAPRVQVLVSERAQRRRMGVAAQRRHGRPVSQKYRRFPHRLLSNPSRKAAT